MYKSFNGQNREKYEISDKFTKQILQTILAGHKHKRSPRFILPGVTRAVTH